MMLAAPMAGKPVDVAGIRFVEGSVIEEQDATSWLHIRSYLVLQRRGVGWLAMGRRTNTTCVGGGRLLGVQRTASVQVYRR